MASDLGKFQKQIKDSPEKLLSALVKKAETHAENLTGRTREGTPMGKHNGGATRENIKAFVEVEGDVLSGGTRSDYPNVIYQEFGTGPIGEAAGYPGEVPGIAYTIKGWSWYAGEEGQQIKADLHGGSKDDYSPWTGTMGQPPKAMFHNAIQSYGDKIMEDFGETVLEVLRDD